jgi:hypothetical protein
MPSGGAVGKIAEKIAFLSNAHFYTIVWRIWPLKGAGRSVTNGATEIKKDKGWKPWRPN